MDRYGFTNLKGYRNKGHLHVERFKIDKPGEFYASSISLQGNEVASTSEHVATAAGNNIGIKGASTTKPYIIAVLITGGLSGARVIQRREKLRRLARARIHGTAKLNVGGARRFEGLRRILSAI